jgi:ABC-2 type transport system ATP-binding protein
MDLPGNNDPVIRVTGLTKRYGELIAVDDLNLEIYRGEIFGFLGPNGAGKSTSINMICGLLQPDAGHIFIHDRQVRHEKKLRNSFGLCPQDIILWPKLTCLEQLIFMGEMYNMRPQEAKKAGIMLLEHLGLESKMHKLGSTLSGGMKRRLNICLALVHDPEIVVLDEPEAGLDPQSRIMVRDFIRSLRQSKTVILTTHNMDEAERLSDRIAIIDNGRLLLTGTPENLKKTAGSGDVLEISIEAENGKDLKDADRLLQAVTRNARINGNVILIREMNVLEMMPVITDKLREANFTCSEIKMRANTLEDVFIYLTGKRLRE